VVSHDSAALAGLLQRARARDQDAFGALVRRFQDAAVGYCYARLGDFGLAEDAAQDAFLEAWRDLPALEHDAAFTTWFRRLLFKQCDRRTRGTHPPMLGLDQAQPVESDGVDHPAARTEAADRLAVVRRALAGLPEDQRTAVLLHYFAGLPIAEVARFVEAPPGTVKSRLHAARRTLRAGDLAVIAEDLGLHRPSRDEEFERRVRRLLQAAAQGARDQVRALLAADRSLTDAPGPHPYWGGQPRALHVAVEWGREAVVRDLLDAGADPNPDSTTYGGWTPLLLATRRGRSGILQLLLDRGARWDAWSAAALGKSEVLRDLLRRQPDLVEARGPNRATPLHFAGSVEVARLLVEAGAPLTVLDQYGGTPLRVVAYSRGIPREVGRYLLELGGEDDVFLRCALGDPAAVAARLDARPELLTARDDHLNAASARGGTLLHLAASLGDVAMATLLLDRGADPNARAEGGETPIHYAAKFGDEPLTRLLLDRGADPRLTDAVQRATPADWARFFGQPAVEHLLAAADRGR
jgi:RNA polymerase sigma factor (sigma-70 family)